MTKVVNLSCKFTNTVRYREEFEEDDSEVEDSEEEQEDMEDYKKGFSL